MFEINMELKSGLKQDQLTAFFLDVTQSENAKLKQQLRKWDEKPHRIKYNT